MFDFAIMSLPRSGSHMLMSAIHSHPDVTMTGELGMIQKFPLPYSDGALRGCIYSSYNLPDIAKWMHSVPVIFLMRDVDDIVASLFKYSPNGTSYRQHLGPTTIAPYAYPVKQERVSQMDCERARMCAYARSRPPKMDMVVTYEELCGNQDTRALACSDGICDFLGIARHELIPMTHKPK